MIDLDIDGYPLLINGTNITCESGHFLTEKKNSTKLEIKCEQNSLFLLMKILRQPKGEYLFELLEERMIAGERRQGPQQEIGAPSRGAGKQKPKKQESTEEAAPCM